MNHPAAMDAGRVAVAVGPSAAGAARAALELGWEVEEVADLEQAGDLLVRADAGLRSALVLAALGDFPTEAFLRLAARLCREAGSLGVGFAYGRSAEQLLAAVRRLGAPDPAPVGEPLHAALAHPHFADLFSGTRVVRAVGPGAPPADELLTAGAEMLYIMGHSTGHEALLGGAVICRREALEESPRPERAFPCYSGAACHYQGTAVHRVDADRVKARVAVLLACSIASPRSPFSPETMIGDGLGASGGVRTLVTTLRTTRAGRDDFLPLYYACRMGLTMGQAVALAN
ncbi:MAG TPA: hypothetical protein VFQ76_10420, partial [Longimicrobiaceae bacterium]|nr:hypothetical protein [Longimicrobiaceae bacterium]